MRRRRIRSGAAFGSDGAESRAATALIRNRVPFRRALFAWYRRHRRRLPWRENPSLYKTVVAEFMLQQTQVKTMLPYFDRWLRVLPGFAALAGLHELPAALDLGLDAPFMRVWPLLLRKTRAIANHRITESIHTVSLTAAQRRRLTANPALRWVPLAALHRFALSGPHRRWIQEGLQSRKHSSAVS